MNNKILILEDDANLLYGLQAKFRIAGFEVIADEGENKEQAIRKIRASKPDYIILDIILPGIDGFGLLSDIKADTELSGIPIFIFTSLSDNDSKERGKRLGADFYLIKNDINLDEFVDKFNKIIANLDKIR